MTTNQPNTRTPGYAADPWVLEARDCGLAPDNGTPADWQLKFLVILGLGAANIHLADIPNQPNAAGTQSTDSFRSDSCQADPFRTDLADLTFVHNPPEGPPTAVTFDCNWATLSGHLTGWFDDPTTNPAGITGVHAIGSGILNWWTSSVGHLVTTHENHSHIALSATGVPPPGATPTTHRQPVMLSVPHQPTWRQTLYPRNGQPFTDWQVRLLMVLAMSGMDATWPHHLDPFTTELNNITMSGPGGDDTSFVQYQFTWADLRNTLNTNLATTTCEDTSLPHALANECWWNWSLALSETIAPRTRTNTHLLVTITNGEPHPAGYTDLAGNPIPEPPPWED